LTKPAFLLYLEQENVMSKAAAHRVPPYKRPILIVGFLVALAIVISMTVLVFKNLKLGDNHTSANNPADNNPINQPDQTPDSPDPEPEDKAPQYEGEDPNLLTELTGSITYIDIDPATNVLHSAVMLDQYLSESGQCVYNIKRDEAIIRTASAITTNDPSNSVCGPFDISVDGLSGSYQIEVIITGDGKRGVITSEIQI